MRRVSALTVIWVVGFVFCETVLAGGIGVTGKVGTLGIGAELTVGITPKMNARAGLNMFSYGMTAPAENEEGEGTGQEIQVDLKLQTIEGLVDWHPWASGFRLSAGLMLNNNELVLSADPNELTEINEVEYLISDLSGNVTFSQIAPYAGIGYGNAAGEGRWHFAFDLGVMFQGSPAVTINATASDPIIQATLDADLSEEAAKMEDELKPFNIYPVLALGVSYTF